jgi:hypothetical protein
MDGKGNMLLIVIAVGIWLSLLGNLVASPADESLVHASAIADGVKKALNECRVVNDGRFACR